MKRRFRILLKSLLVLPVLVFLLLLVERWRGQISLGRFKRELDARGETLDVQKLLGSPVADADNGAPELLRLKALLREGKAIPTNYPPSMRWIAPGKAMVGLRENLWGHNDVTNSWADVSLDLATNKEVLGSIRAVLAKSGFDFKLDHSRGVDMNLRHLAQAKSLCLWLGTACQEALRNGKNQAAHEDLLAAVAIPKVLEHDHVIISELVRVAISSINFGTTWEALQADVWTEEQWAALQNAWESNTFVTNMILSLRVERADGESYFERFRNSNDATYKSMFPTWRSALSDEDEVVIHWWQGEFFRKQIYCRLWRFAWLYQDENFYLRGMQLLIDDSRSGAAKANQEPNENWFGLAESSPPNFYDNLRFGISTQDLPDFSVASVKSARAETMRSMVLCAIALKRYQIRHGTPAPDLNALVPEFLPEVPVDYMSGKAMKYRLSPGGAPILYSVGDDGNDDGGDPSPMVTSHQKYPGIWRGKDVVWPLPATPQEIKAWRDKSSSD
jgi:hypothetical protein